MKASEILLLSAGAVSAAAVLCGYTTLRVPLRGKAEKTRVACVGDSLSYGCALPLFWLRRYPAVLGRLLGPDYQVAAFAVNDRTLQDTGNKPYRRERAFAQSKAFRPDVVILLLGSNDAKDRNWVSSEAIRQACAALIAEYRGLPTRPRILVCTPPQAFPPFSPPFGLPGDAERNRLPEIAAAVADAAGDEGLELVDLYALTRDRRDLFGPDGLHFCARGARAVAEAVRSVLASREPAQGR